MKRPNNIGLSFGNFFKKWVEYMRQNLYGSAGNASMDPKTFMIQALKKIRLNNNNILKFIKEEQSFTETEHKIRMRVINTNGLLDQMKVTLNIEDNEVAVSVLMTFEWLAQENEELLSFIKMQDTLEMEDEKMEESMKEKIEAMNYTITNIQEGFEGIE
jgi:hypothetical protein